MERNWKLGDDLIDQDFVLDPITFVSIILCIQCNEKVHDKEAVLRCYEDILEQRLEDARFLVRNNIEEIIKYANFDYEVINNE